nr:glycosyltransferase family 4 protein [Candidatus Baldrarchaeota archaeon]
MGYNILLIGSSSGIGLTFHFTRLAVALKRLGNKVVVLSDNKEQYANLPKELNRHGIKRCTTDGIDDPDIMSMIRCAGDIRKILRREGNFDIIHAGGVKHGVKVHLATQILNNRPKTLATIGSLPGSRIGMGIASISYSLFYDKCIALCNYTRERLIKWGINPSKICVIPLFAPDLEWFDKAKKVKINLEDYNLEDVTKPVIFYAASHFHHKGFPYYLMAASTILKKFDATFVVGGKGPLTNSLKNLTEKLGIARHVVFTGWISNYHIPYVLSNIADICVSTSLVEQLPSYIMECMAAGKPVVASRVGGVPEIVINGVNGYLVPLHDYAETAQRIMDLLSNPEKAQEMGAAGRKMIEKEFNMKLSILKLLKLYEESVKG